MSDAKNDSNLAFTVFMVQYELPCEHPEDKVLVERKRVNGKLCFVFYVPINTPKSHNLGFQDLLELTRYGQMTPEQHEKVVAIIHRP